MLIIGGDTKADASTFDQHYHVQLEAVNGCVSHHYVVLGIASRVLIDKHSEGWQVYLRNQPFGPDGCRAVVFIRRVVVRSYPDARLPRPSDL
jgi:hypothetical protein